MKKKLMIGLALVLAAVTVLAVPALAQESDSPDERRTRGFPPQWVDESFDDLIDRVNDRAEKASERISESPRLDDEQKAELLAAIDDMLAAVGEVDDNAEVAGLVVSRTQLERREFRAERNGEEVDHESHVADDVERAGLRLERLTKVTGWAEAAGEDVAGIQDALDGAGSQLAAATGDGTVVGRHDAVHIALAWMTQAAVGLDDL
jgi:hypothetical protein